MKGEDIIRGRGNCLVRHDFCFANRNHAATSLAAIFLATILYFCMR